MARTEVRTSTAPEGTPTPTKPTIGDVARLAGVSKSAVSLVFNGRSGVGAETRERILIAAKSLGWEPSARARALSSSRALALGLVLRRQPELLSTDPFFPQFLAGVEAGLAPHGYALVLQVVTDAESERAAYDRFAREGRVDAVFLTDLRQIDPRLTLVSELRLKALLVGRYDSPGSFAKLGVDDESGVHRAVNHLRSLGHEKIGHVGGTSDYVHTVARKQAWEHALTAVGLARGPLALADYTGSGGERATHELLDLPEPPTAILYGNDNMAIAGIAAALSRGLRVPEDLSVVGFDDVPLAPYVSPALTTIRQDVVAWGRAAAEVLINLVEGRELGTPNLPKAQFIVRASTAQRANYQRTN